MRVFEVTQTVCIRNIIWYFLCSCRTNRSYVAEEVHSALWCQLLSVRLKTRDFIPFRPFLIELLCQSELRLKTPMNESNSPIVLDTWNDRHSIFSDWHHNLTSTVFFSLSLSPREDSSCGILCQVCLALNPFMTN